MIDRKVVGNNLLQLRSAYGFSQFEFARHCGLARTDILRIERGEKSISPDEVCRIASALQCNPCDLLLFISETQSH